MIKPVYPATDEDSCVFPKCARNCEILPLLGAGECESVCPEKFEKDGKAKNSEEGCHHGCSKDCGVHERRGHAENGC